MLGVISHKASPPVSIYTLWKYVWRHCGGLRGRHVVARRRIRQQYPVVGAFVANLLLFRVVYNVALFVGLTTVSILGEISRAG